MQTLVRDCLELTKPRVMSLILVTHVLGFLLARPFTTADILTVSLSMLGTLLSCAGAAMLNSYLERDIDARMPRTMHRPLPSGRLNADEVLEWGLAAVLAGVMILATYVNLLTGFLALLTAFLYVLVYTPLKRKTWLNTSIGAIPGALPALGGCTAATGEIDLIAWVIFGILFAWQHPHFYAIAWMYRDDYAQADFKMLSVVDPSGERTFRHAIAFTFLLIAISVVPTIMGQASIVYALCAVTSGVLMLRVATSAARSRSVADARGLLIASVQYLPFVLGCLAVDAMFIA